MRNGIPRARQLQTLCFQKASLVRPSNSANLSIPPALEMSKRACAAGDASFFIASDSKRSVYPKSNGMFTSRANSLFTLKPMNDLTKRVLDLAFHLKKWNLVEFANAMNVEKQHVNNWKERGIPHSRLPKAAQVLGVTVDELLTGVHPVNPPEEPRTVTHWGITVTEAGFLLAKEWDQLQEPEKTQIHNLVHGIVGKLRREEVHKTANVSLQPSGRTPSSKPAERSRKSAQERHRKPN